MKSETLGLEPGHQHFVQYCRWPQVSEPSSLGEAYNKDLVEEIKIKDILRETKLNIAQHDRKDASGLRFKL